MWDRAKLLNVCRRHVYAPQDEVFMPEPYLPYVPSNWNGVLVLAESQNLSNPTGAWEKLLLDERIPIEDKMERLCWRDSDRHGAKSLGLGIGPWDDGTVQLALKAMMPEIHLEAVAVGNAVPWSRTAVNGRNVNPNARMKETATDFWKDLLAEWRPDFRAVLLLGRVAADVLEPVLPPGVVPLKLRLPSPNVLDRVRGMFSKADLLARYREISEAAVAIKRTRMMDLTDNAVLYAAHAVSLGKQRFGSLR